MTHFLAYRDLQGRLIPCDVVGQEALQKVPINSTVAVKVSRPRNILHHRKFFALLNLVYQNQSRYPTLDDLLDAIKVYVGHCEEMEIRGRTVYRPKSIAFHRMDQAAFDQFYDAVVKAVCEYVLPNVCEEDLRREIEEFVSAA